MITKHQNCLCGNIVEALEVTKSFVQDDVLFMEAGLCLATAREIEEIEEENTLIDYGASPHLAQDWIIELDDDCHD